MDVYVGPEGVLTGSSRLSQEAREKAAALVRQEEVDRKERERNRKREALEARIAAFERSLKRRKRRRNGQCRRLDRENLSPRKSRRDGQKPPRRCGQSIQP